MKILVIGMSSNLGGVECFLKNYVCLIAGRKDISFDFLIYEDKCVFENVLTSLGCGVYKITYSRFKEYVAFHKELKHFYRENASKYDIVWMNDCSLANARDLLYAKKYGVPRRIFHCHNNRHMRSDKKKYFYRALHDINKLFIGAYATDFWACSKAAGLFGFPLWLRNKTVVIPNAIKVSDFKYDEKIRLKYRQSYNVEGKFIIGCVGRLHFQKNQLFLLDIYKEVQSRVPKSELWLIGEGEDRAKIESKIVSLGLSDCVKMFGARNDIPKIMQALDCFVLPSKFEGFGIVLIEAQAEGLPVYASKDVIPEAVCVTNNFKFLPLNETPDFWADAIVKNGANNDRIAGYYKLKSGDYDLTSAADNLANLFLSMN